MLRVNHTKQLLTNQPMADVAAGVWRALDSLEIPPPRGEVAITAGSRGIANIALITRTVGEWLRHHGAKPFIIPSMGSHNGATASGQRAMVESLGITESAMKMEIRASMECIKVGEVATGDVWMDRHSYEADGVLVLNRIKLHTCFPGDLQSGLIKMMVVGMGKIRSAQTFHSAPTPSMNTMLHEMGQCVLDSGKIWAGLGIMEDGFDQTTELHAIRPAEIIAREQQLLERHRTEFFPRLPIDDLNVLVVGQIGKTFSGTGMDTNVIGFRGTPQSEDLSRPNIRTICALDLAEASQGNAIGVGLADFCTRRLRDAIDEEKTLINTYTTGDMQRCKIPATLANDETLINAVIERFGPKRWMFIPNTLHLDSLYVSEDLQAEVAANSICVPSLESEPLQFEQGRLTLRF